MNTISEKELAFELEMNYNKDSLYELWYMPIKDFLLKNNDKSWDGKIATDITLGTDLEKMPQKIPMAIICANFYSNKAALLDWYESLGEEDKRLVAKATWQEFVSYKELEEIYGYPVINVQEQPSNQYYRESYRMTKDKRFKQWHQYIYVRDTWNSYNINSAQKYLEDKSPKFVFPDMMRKALVNALPKPEGYFLKPTTVAEEIVIFNTEETIFREIPLITAYYLQDKIAYSQKGYPTAATARKMMKTLQLKSFPLEGENTLRALMIAGLFEGFAMTSISESPLTILEKLFSRNFEKKPPAPFLLPHLKGANYFYYTDFKGDVTINIFEIFKDMPVGNWITFENIKQFASTHFIKLLPLSNWRISKLSIDFGASGNYGKSINDTNVDDYLCLPNLAGHIFLLAAFGLMEISIDENKPLQFSFYDGLQACRLTALGAYLLGITPNYTQPQSESETKLLFDEQSLIIRIEGNILLGDTMMNDFATKVSGNRYQFSPEKFLKSCKSTRDLENKIALFKQTINQKLPDFWENYLQQLINNSRAVLPKRNINVFKLPTENKELHRIIAQDNELRRIIIKAEGFLVLVEEKQITAFINRMKELGYLIG